MPYFTLDSPLRLSANLNVCSETFPTFQTKHCTICWAFTTGILFVMELESGS